MKSKETKQNDLNALAEQLGNSKSAMIVSFNKLTVNKDQEFRNHLREAGAKYQVVKNTIARLAVKGTAYAEAAEHFKGVTAIAWTDNDPVVLSKAISKFVKENADFYTFKAGVVDGRIVSQKEVEAIASLPSKEELISKLLYVLNAQAQRIVTVINAVPRDLAVVIKAIGDKIPAVAAPAAEAKAEEPKAEAPVEAAPAAEEAPVAEAAPAEETPAQEAAPVEETPAAEAAPAEEVPAQEAAPSAETTEEAPAREAAPVTEDVPAAEETVEAASAEEAPVAEEAAPAADEAPAAEETVEAAPAEETASEVTEEAPAAEEAPAEEGEKKAE
jgi:large subunit ribosomal protein L10